MASPRQTKLLLRGDFSGDGFLPWIAHRAGILGLAGWVKPRSPELIEVLIIGEQVLLEAFEVACSLGPIDVQVDSVECQPASTIEKCSDFTIYPADESRHT